ncbi:MarR family winged helix-turn-helix transcriptional regulator [Lacrimispora sp.]|uniref:MarR family winged helix-turn-helix transcriptional regulator n=1 Tax=Lacrimispora sp. TaxID=2719234 RepID=UPI0028A1A429|nr:MarR family transcriptional regulator [Lacrimispora sp.]
MSDLSREVINSFISLTEKTANSKTNFLDFGSPDMTFYRGEIHIIKMVGDYPGIFSSEVARKFGVTRAVIHKTLLKLEERELVKKSQEDNDKKRIKLFLTDKGKQAYNLHEQYHSQHDNELFEYVNTLTTEQLEAINGFLQHANNLIQNHA